MLEKTLTPNPIEYDWYVTGPQGARYILYPVRDVHEEGDVKRAVRWLRNNQDVVSLQVRWKTVEKVDDVPLKIPDYIIIKNLQITIGQLRAEIDDLKYQLEEEKKKDPVKKREIKKEELYANQQEKIKQLEKTIRTLKRDKEDLIIRLNQKT